jgi:hypothetical protein
MDIHLNRVQSFVANFLYMNDLKEKYGYADEEECYADRHNHRAEWYDAICAYNVV